MKTLAEVQYSTIVERLRHYAGSKESAAKSLGISRSTMYRFCEIHPEVDAEMRERRKHGLRQQVGTVVPEVETLPTGQV